MRYEYKCGGCKTVFERVLRIAEMNEPLEQPCPECAAEGHIARHIGNGTPMGDHTKLFPFKSQGGFKEVLNKIHHNNWKSNLNSKF